MSVNIPMELSARTTRADYSSAMEGAGDENSEDPPPNLLDKGSGTHTGVSTLVPDDSRVCWSLKSFVRGRCGPIARSLGFCGTPLGFSECTGILLYGLWCWELSRHKVI